MTADPVASLRELMDERDVRYQQRFEAQQEAVKEALISINVRLGMLNNLRSGVATSAELEALDKTMDALTIRVQVLETTRAAADGQVRKIYTAIGAAVGLIGLVIVLVGRFGS